MKISESHRRRCGGFYEGHGEYRTFHPDYEYKCPECGRWSREGSDVTTEVDDGEATLCPGCASRVTADCGCGSPATHGHHDRPCCGGSMCCPTANE